jgi:predicted type IV restriction endonuclease
MITLSLEGAQDALDVLRELIVPWRRKNAEQKAKLEIALKQAEIQRMNGEILLAQAKANREKASATLDDAQAKLLIAQADKVEAEARLILAQAHKAHIEAEQSKIALLRLQIDLALQIVERYAAGLEDRQKMEYVIRLLPVLDKLAFIEDNAG